MDYIIIENINIYAYHGALPEERSIGQEFRVNLELGIDLSTHNQLEDNLESVSDYRQAVRYTEEVMQGSSCMLLETLACRIADKLLTIPGILEAKVEVVKPNPPIPSVRGGIKVTVNRKQ